MYNWTGIVSETYSMTCAVYDMERRLLWITVAYCVKLCRCSKQHWTKCAFLACTALSVIVKVYMCVSVAANESKQRCDVVAQSTLTQCEMSDHAAKYEGGQEWQGYNEGVEEAVVTLAHTVSDPGAVMVKPLCECTLQYIISIKKYQTIHRTCNKAKSLKQ